MLKKIKSIIKTTLFGGTLVVLLIVSLILVFNWLYGFISDKIKPITYILAETTRIQEFFASILAIMIILICFFVVGIIVKIKLGKYTFEYFEQKFFFKLPLYNIIRETRHQLVGSEKTLFKYVALVRIFGSDVRLTARITEEHDDWFYNVFVPSAPAPTAGLIYHLAGENVKIIDYSVDKALKTILSLCAGSKELLKLLNTEQRG